MRPDRYAAALALAAGLSLSLCGVTSAQKHVAPVPPELEIEVLDPGVDPLGNPAVVTVPDPNLPGVDRIDIPPVVLVHRYYYTGERTFQGPMIPGGPSILVMSHPRTGERCYISAQMLPGAPRVKYCSRSIEYDYGESGITVVFGPFGEPTVKYRSGRTWTQKAGRLVHYEAIEDHVVHSYQRAKVISHRTHTAACGLVVEVKDASKIVVLPISNTVRLLPFGAALTSGDLEEHLTQRGIEHKREHAIKRAEQEKERETWDNPTLR